jgi:hypothetical protein
VVDQIVEVERVDLAGVQVCEAVAYALEQSLELLFVVGGDEFASRASASALVRATAARRLPIHAGTQRPTGRRGPDI